MIEISDSKAASSLPDRKAVIYTIKQNGVDSLWVQPLYHSPGHQLTHFASEEITDFHWSPNGKTLAITRQHDTADAVLLVRRTTVNRKKSATGIKGSSGFSGHKTTENWTSRCRIPSSTGMGFPQ